MTIEEFVRQYGTHGPKLLIMELVANARQDGNRHTDEVVKEVIEMARALTDALVSVTKR